MSKDSQINLVAFTQQLQSLPVTQLHKLDSILSELANYVHDIVEKASELLEVVKTMTMKEKKKNLTEMVALQEEITSMRNLLYEMEYDSHYMEPNA